MKAPHKGDSDDFSYGAVRLGFTLPKRKKKINPSVRVIDLVSHTSYTVCNSFIQ